MDIVLSVTEKTDTHLHNRLLTSRKRTEQNDKGSEQNDPVYVKLFDKGSPLSNSYDIYIYIYLRVKKERRERIQGLRNST